MRTLLIDADIPAYMASAISQEDTAFGSATDLKKACAEADKFISEVMEDLKGDKALVCLTCPEHNFRLDVLPSYKSNRIGTKRPELLKDVKQYLAEEYDSYTRYSLEADDCMGILATHPHLIEGDKVIVSSDKDMRTIPAKVYHPHRPENGVMDISRLDADRFLMWQTICGDMTDGYGGAKGVGKSSEWAKDIIAADREELWDEVLGAYSSVGMNETQAIQQARCARILRAEDFDFKKKEVILWEPEMLMV